MEDNIKRYLVQLDRADRDATAVDAKHHLIVAHEVTHIGHDHDQLAHMAKPAKAAKGLFDQRDFVYDNKADQYRCPAAGHAIHRMTSEEAGKTLHKYGSSAVAAAPSSRGAPPAKSGASHGGRTQTHWTLFNNA